MWRPAVLVEMLRTGQMREVPAHDENGHLRTLVI